MMQSHQKNKRTFQFCKGIYLFRQCLCAICRGMPCYDMKAARKPPMGDGNPCRRRHCNRRAYARNHLIRDACRLQGKHLLAPSAKHEGVAALQPYNRFPLLCLGNKQSIDFRLRHGMSAITLADKKPFAVRPGFLQKLWGGQIIIEHCIACPQKAQTLPCNQIGIAAACPDQINRSAHFRNLLTTSAASCKRAATGALPSA